MSVDIEKFIQDRKLELEASSRVTGEVGNRPHSPMLILFHDGETCQTVYDTVFSRMQRVWPQTLRYLVPYRYRTTGENEICFSSFDDLSDIREQDITEKMGRVSIDGNTVFESMRWRFYNILDTSSFRSADEFIACYQAVQPVRRIMKESFDSMLILLLDDSLDKREIANSIRSYLAERRTPEYDSVLIISNRARSRKMYSMTDLYRIAASVLLLSNNDSVAAVDDADYRERSAALYGGGVYTVSYIIQEKPNRKIAMQLLETVLSEMMTLTGTYEEPELGYWLKKLEIESGKCRFFEDFLRNVRLNLDLEAFTHLPMKRKAVDDRINYQKITFSDFKEYVFDDALQPFAKRYLEELLNRDADVETCVQKFRNELLLRFHAAELRLLTEDMIERILASLHQEGIRENVTIPQYFQNLLLYQLREAVLYPRLREILRELRDTAETACLAAGKIQEDFRKYTPIDGYAELGTIYADLVRNKVRSGNGRERILRICLPGSDREAILAELEKYYAEILRENRELFSLPFVDVKAKILNRAGNLVYREIRRILTQEVEERIMLCGNYPVDKRLTVYMLQTALDRDGAEKTELFEYLQEAFAGVPHVQYFNTGCSDALEAVTLVTCEGEKLLL